VRWRYFWRFYHSPPGASSQFHQPENKLVVDNGQLSGLKMRWTMDEITSADLLYDAGNAKPAMKIWKKLAAEVMANVLGQHYFTEFWHNGQKVKFLIDRRLWPCVKGIRRC
jgi:ABC-type uncharacterized transport system substrate-binding protein